MYPKYPHPISDAYLQELRDSANEAEKGDADQQAQPNGESIVAMTPSVSAFKGDAVPGTEGTTSIPQDETAKSQVDTPDVPLRFVEKKRLHWAGKTCRHGVVVCSLKSLTFGRFGPADYRR